MPEREGERRADPAGREEWTCPHRVTYTGTTDFIGGARNAHDEFDGYRTGRSMNDIAQDIIELCPKAERFCNEWVESYNARLNACAKFAAAGLTPKEEMLTAEIRRFQAPARPRWGVKLPFLPGELEGYGSTLREALEAVAEGVVAADEEIARERLRSLSGRQGAGRCYDRIHGTG